METYLLVNTAFLIAVVLFLRIRVKKPGRPIIITLITLIILTAVFDSIIVGFEIVGYDANKILGILIGKAPVEDFFYAILAVILVPTLWKRMEGNHGNN